MDKHRGKKGYLFTVDILVEGYGNGIALERLINLLNSEQIKDYRITKGIELGKIIEASLLEGKPVPAQIPLPKEAPKAEEKVDDKRLTALIDTYKRDNTLVRLTAMKGKGVKLSIPCRILNFDETAETLTVYHVDEKKVYQFHLTEVDDFSVNG